MIDEGKGCLPPCQGILTVTTPSSRAYHWDMPTIGARIKEMRDEFGWSQTELGKRVGVTRNAVSQWESDSNSIKPDNIRKLATLFGVTLAWLWEGITPKRAKDIGAAGVVAGGATRPPGFRTRRGDRTLGRNSSIQKVRA